jgi:ATP-dependent DNA helicase RecG
LPEQQNIEYKQIWHDDYLKWVCGFANSIGGIIYIGKNDSGNVVHLPNYERLMADVPNKIRNSMGIICDVQLEDDEGSKYISIKVSPYSVAVSLRGRFYYRSGSTNLELTGVELTEFLLKKTGKTWDDVVEEGANIQDINEDSLKKFIEDSKEKGRMPETKGLSTFEILEKLQLTDGSKLKRAAIVLFGKDPSRFYPNVQVNIGRFRKDSTDLKFQEIVEGNLVHILNEVQVQLNHKFLTRPVVFSGMQRIENDEYPVDALREMLLNALVHRTYMGAHIQMRVYDDRLSIWNEGGLPLGLILEELKKEHNSRPRNPKIAKACFMAGYIDTWGRGTLKIINACKEAKLPEPDILEKDGGILVILHKRSEHESSQVSNQARSLTFSNIEDIIAFCNQAGNQADNQASDQASEVVNAEIHTRVADILKIAKSWIRREDLFNAIKISNQSKNRKKYLDPLIDLGWISMEYPDKKTHPNQKYKITEPGINLLKLISKP